MTGQLPLGIIFLSGGVCLWIGSFDAIYGSQDREFDLKHHLHSLATKFGVAKAHRIAAYLHCVSILCFILTGIYFDVILDLLHWRFNCYCNFNLSTQYNFTK